MKRNRLIFSLFGCLLAVLFLFGSAPCLAQGADVDGGEAIAHTLEGILQFKGATDVQAWINGELTETAGIGAEWYILALAQSGSYDFSTYESALLEYLSAHTVSSASSRLKYALCLAAIGSTDVYISKAVNESIGEQGLMSWVFGLHLLSSGYQSAHYTAEAVKAKLLDLQREDGGWAIAGQYSDVDATAMTLQALAPYCEADPSVQNAADRAVAWLSQSQRAEGSYASFGVANPESGAQVLIALSALGVDALADPRFEKSGGSILDGITAYRLPSGGFCHVAGGEFNENASSQVLLALVSYQRMVRGEASVFLLDHADPDRVTPAPSIPDNGAESGEESTEESSNGPNVNSGTEKPKGGAPSYKLWVSLAIIALGGIGALLLVVLKKRHVKNFIALLLVCAIAIAVVFTTEFRSADDYYNGEDVTKENAIGSVTLTIRCDSVAGQASHIPESGRILDAVQMPIAEGDSVYTVLTDAARRYQLQIENNGSSSHAYIAGINYLYELDFGDLSGWVYLVNGVRTSVGAGEYKLSDGDVIEWYYTLNLGEDIS